MLDACLSALCMELLAMVFVYLNLGRGAHWRPITGFLHQDQKRLTAPWEVQQNVHVRALK